uniref:Bromo domain-containing protein n=1 Tax=Echeneis naucrates TaxID=173247 RepID=A0A665VUU2_ECHNA
AAKALLKTGPAWCFSNNDLSLPEVCISTNSNTFEEDMNYEVQQAYRIFTGFLLDKHKGITSPFLHPVGHQEAQHGIGGVRGWGQAQLRQSMCLRRMEEKFTNQEYETITEFVADFRLMLENCYRYHGVDHWLSKQAQKLEIMLEQKLTLLSRTLREKTTLAVTSKGCFGAEEERGSGGTSTRRRLAPRSLATITVGGHESIMVQTLRLEEQQRAKEEKRQRELEKKEAEEMSAKEVEEWEQTLLSQASPHTVDTLWELPAIGHFLCLAQTALNLPEIVFFELERCLLMPRCSLLLSKIMSSLLSPPQRRATLHRRPALPYRRWESELRQRVIGWYRVIGASHDQLGRAEQLGLCHQFFSILGEVSPLEEKPFHLLPFYQRVWLLKGLCDHVYETQKGVQDAVLAQPIHECRESVLGYDSKENAYIHFPHFCGADLRIYCQSPSTPPSFPFPSVLVKRVDIEQATEGVDSDGMKDEWNKRDRECYGCSMETRNEYIGKERAEILGLVCTSLEELRELISKAEDELDDLESTKKRLGRWYYRREAVKDLHSTLIRLLNELSPWEPKLVKAYQRNRYNSLFREFVADCAGETIATYAYVPPIQLKHPLVTTDKGVSALSRVQMGSSNITSTSDSESQFRPELTPSNQTRDSNSAEAAGFPTQTPLSPKPSILHPTIGLPKGYTPIPTLLAKSVGNKVTLMKLHNQPGMATVTAAPLKSPQGKPTQTAPNCPVQMVYKVPEGLGHLVRKDSSSPVKISVQPVTTQSTAEKVMQQVVILPSNLLIHKTEETTASLHQQSKGIQVPVSKVAGPLCMSTNVPGFSIPENRIPVQQVAPLKEDRRVRTPSPSVSPRQQQGTLNIAGFKGSHVCTTQSSTPQGGTPNASPITIPSSAVSNESIESADTKQELKTVCIRDSQSILVTTRGGNTGIVKVQASSDHSVLGSLPTSPVITISPQFKAFLVSKTSPTFPPASSQTSPFTVNLPVTCPGSQTTVSTVALSQGSSTAICSTVATKTGQLAQTASAGSHFQASLVKNTVVPSVSTSGLPQVLPQAEISKIGVKRASTDERSQVTKYILVTPSSSSNSNVALPKGSTSSPKSLPTSRVMYISQPTATSSTTFMGSIPKQAIATTALSSLKMESSSGQTLGSGTSEALPNITNISLPSDTLTTCSAQLASLTTCSQLQSIPSFAMIPQITSPTSTEATLPAGNGIKKQLGMCASEHFSTSPAQVTTTMQSNQAQTSTSIQLQQHSKIQSATYAENTSFLSTQLSLNKTCTCISSPTTTSTPFTTSATGTIQQRIVINTSTPLVAGTQILLNSTRFVVPPQGLGPGSHVLIITSPAPQQVPTTSAADTGVSLPLHGVSHVTAAPRAPILSCPFSNSNCLRTTFYFLAV